MNNTDNKEMEVTKRNAQEILKELYEKHKESRECGIYDITPDGKLGDKLYEMKG